MESTGFWGIRLAISTSPHLETEMQNVNGESHELNEQTCYADIGFLNRQPA